MSKEIEKLMENEMSKLVKVMEGYENEIVVLREKMNETKKNINNIVRMYPNLRREEEKVNKKSDVEREEMLVKAKKLLSERGRVKMSEMRVVLGFEGKYSDNLKMFLLRHEIKWDYENKEFYI